MATFDWIQETLEKHNKFREIHLAAPLEWSGECYEAAKLQAEACAATGILERGNASGTSGEHGQNLFKSDGDRPEYAIQEWYNESEKYDFSRPGIGDALQFTQLVWAGTTHVGLACSDDGQFIVANYWPSGNDTGTFDKNVLSPVKQERAAELVAGSEVEKIGMHFSTLPPNPIVVKKVTPGSWAAEMGVEVGDIIMEVNGLPVNKLDPEMFRQFLAGRPVTLKLPDAQEQWATLRIQCVFRILKARKEVAFRRKEKAREDRMKEAGVYTREDRLRAVFALLDTSKDGNLEQSEMLAFIRHLDLVSREEELLELYSDLCTAYGWNPSKGLNLKKFRELVNDASDDWYRTDDQLAQMHERLVLEASLKPRQGRRGDVGRGYPELVADLSVDKTGMKLSMPPNPLVVKVVIPGGWAEDKGIEIGDTFMEVNGTPVAGMSSLDLKHAMQQRPLRLRLAEEHEHIAAAKMQSILRGRLQRQMTSNLREKLSKREELVHRLFVATDQNTDGFLDARELLSIVRRMDFSGTDEEWFKVYPVLCGEYDWDVKQGLALKDFTQLVNDKDDDWYCTNDQLQVVLDGQLSFIAAIRVQRLVRGRQARKQVKAMKHEGKVEAAVIRIQSRFRGNQARESVKQKWAQLEAKRREEECEAAAVRIQSAERARVARQEVRGMRDARTQREVAAVRIQNAERARVARQQVSAMRDAKAESDQQRETAALRIQSAERARVARQEVGAMRAAHAKHDQQRETAALRIQSAERARVARQEVGAMRVAKAEKDQQRELAALRIQSAERARVARQEVGAMRAARADTDQHREIAALRIQSAERARVARQQVGAMRVARAEHDQQTEVDAMRAEIARQEWAATRIQSAQRARVANRDVAARREQRFRQEQRFRELEKRERAAICIQCFERARIATRKVEARRKEKDLEVERRQLVEAVFKIYDIDKDGRLSESEFLPFARSLGFPGSRKEWALVYDDLGTDYGFMGGYGIDVEIFEKLINNRRDSAWYCSNDSLRQCVRDQAAIKVQKLMRGKLVRQHPHIYEQHRQDLMRQTYETLDRDGNGWLNARELFLFARCFEFPGDLDEWTDLFSELIIEYEWDPRGMDLNAFVALVSDEEDTWYASDDTLHAVLEQLEFERAAVKIQTSQRRRQETRTRAALMIQNAARVRSARREVMALREQRSHQPSAAVRIQSAEQARVARGEVAKQLRNDVVAQASPQHPVPGVQNHSYRVAWRSPGVVKKRNQLGTVQSTETPPVDKDNAKSASQHLPAQPSPAADNQRDRIKWRRPQAGMLPFSPQGSNRCSANSPSPLSSTSQRLESKAKQPAQQSSAAQSQRSRVDWRRPAASSLSPPQSLFSSTSQASGSKVSCAQHSPAADSQRDRVAWRWPLAGRLSPSQPQRTDKRSANSPSPLSSTVPTPRSKGNQADSANGSSAQLSSEVERQQRWRRADREEPKPQAPHMIDANANFSAFVQEESLTSAFSGSDSLRVIWRKSRSASPRPQRSESEPATAPPVGPEIFSICVEAEHFNLATPLASPAAGAPPALRSQLQAEDAPAMQRLPDVSLQRVNWRGNGFQSPAPQFEGASGALPISQASSTPVA